MPCVEWTLRTTRNNRIYRIKYFATTFYPKSDVFWSLCLFLFWLRCQWDFLFLFWLLRHECWFVFFQCLSHTQMHLFDKNLPLFFVNALQTNGTWSTESCLNEHFHIFAVTLTPIVQNCCLIYVFHWVRLTFHTISLHTNVMLELVYTTTYWKWQHKIECTTTTTNNKSNAQRQSNGNGIHNIFLLINRWYLDWCRELFATDSVMS